MSRQTSPTADDAVADALLEYLHRPEYRPLAQRELLHRTHVPPQDRPRVRQLIRRLLDEGRLRKVSGGRLAVVPAFDGQRGVLHRHREGLAFVVSEVGGEDVFVASEHLGRAGPGDHVAVRVTGRGKDGRLHGVVTRVLEQRNREVMGIFLERADGGIVQPFDPQLGESIRIRAAFRHDAEHLHAVRVELLPQGRRGGIPEGKVLERLGHLDESGTDVRVVSRKYGLATRFSADAERAAQALPTRVPRSAARDRERFDDPPPVTIDGETAKDFDDAIAVQELPGGGFRLFVHIADVAHFVRPGDVLDAEARHRGTSVYFPDRVYPMFPEELSNGLCSLRPGVDRLVQSVVIDLGPRGAVERARFADGVIRSSARLTYTQVADALEGKKGHGVSRRLVPMLQVADRLRGVLERRRHARGSIDFDLPEPQILLDVEGVMTGITIEPRNHAHRMIEEFMILANEAVATELERNGFPCAYRIHEPPDADRLAALASFVEGFGQRLGRGDGSVTAQDIQAMIENIEGRPEYRVISQVALRSMKQARYSPDNAGHFGLASSHYCHFTSPIRRYPDLMVHRLLRALRHGEPPVSDHQGHALRGLCETSSELERNAESSERELLTWKKVAFIEGQVGERFDGVITGVARFGIFVQLIDNMVEGLIKIEGLGGEWFEHVESRFELRGEESGRRFRLGDRLRVRVDRVDRVLQRVDLSLDESDRPSARRGAGEARRARRSRGKPTRRRRPASRRGR